MRSEVIVTFDPETRVAIELAHAAPMTHDEARAWLDRQFVDLGCEPLRATGKVLTADKVAVVAEAAGPEKLADAAWAEDFGRAVTAALGRSVVRVDAATLTITF